MVVEGGREDAQAPPAGRAIVRSRGDIAGAAQRATQAQRRAAAVSLDDDAEPAVRHEAAQDADFLDGVVLTLAWARGDRPEAPITRAQPAEVTVRALQLERGYADDAVEQGRDRWAADWLPPRWYGEGVRQAISWLLGDKSTPPASRPAGTGDPQ
jgi:hypothetical protein